MHPSVLSRIVRRWYESVAAACSGPGFSGHLGDLVALALRGATRAGHPRRWRRSSRPNDPPRAPAAWASSSEILRALAVSTHSMGRGSHPTKAEGRGQDEVGELGIERQDGAVQLGADHDGRDHAVVDGRGARVAGDDLGEAGDVRARESPGRPAECHPIIAGRPCSGAGRVRTDAADGAVQSAVLRPGRGRRGSPRRGRSTTVPTAASPASTAKMIALPDRTSSATWVSLRWVTRSSTPARPSPPSR